MGVDWQTRSPAKEWNPLTCLEQQARSKRLDARARTVVLSCAQND